MFGSYASYYMQGLYVPQTVMLQLCVFAAVPDGVCWCMQTVDDVHAWLQPSDDDVLLG